MLAATATASAQPAPVASLWERAPLALELHGGYEAPIGFLGMGLDYSPLEWLSASGAAGIGSGHGGNRARLAIGARARVLSLGRGRIALGIDYSTGSWKRVEIDTTLDIGDQWDEEPDIQIFADRLHWLSPGIGLEIRHYSGLVLRFYWGLAVPLNPGDVRCGTDVSAPRCTGDGDRGLFPFVGIAIGAQIPWDTPSRTPQPDVPAARHDDPARLRR